MSTGRVDLGHGLSCFVTSTTTGDGQAGCVLEGGVRRACSLRHAGEPPRRTWKAYLAGMEQEDPLTLSPSILRTDCGLHGWIRNGRWEPA